MTEPEHPETWRGGTNRDPWWEEALTPAADTGDDDELPEEFVPPEPTPIPPPAPPTVLGVAGVLSGLLLVLRPSWLANLLAVHPTLVMVIGVVLFLSGALALLYRLRNPTEEELEEDDDDGAVV